MGDRKQGFVALISGGKDSVYAIMECERNGYELVCCANLVPPADCGKDELDSWMYQSAAHGAVAGVAECLGVPLVRGDIKGTARRKDLAYFEVIDGDEVEDLYDLLKRVKLQFPDVTAVSSGAVLSTYQRVRVEAVCKRLDLMSLSYLWQRPQRVLLKEMMQSQLDAIIVKTASLGLEPAKHLGKHLFEVADTLFPRLHERFGFHECGEGGEYESLVLNCPRFHRRLVLDDIIHDFDPSAPSDTGAVGVLHVRSWHTEAKDQDSGHSFSEDDAHNEAEDDDLTIDDNEPSIKTIDAVVTLPQSVFPTKSPCAAARIGTKVSSGTGGIQCASLVVIANATNIETAMQSALQQLPPPEYCFYANLYLSNMSDFAAANEVYAAHFNTCRPPPSRVCLGLAQKDPSKTTTIAIDVDCCEPHLRQALHVRSISHWAPVCIGPYCQANTVADSFVFVAGQIPLQPASMTLLPDDSPQKNIQLCLDHCAAVLNCTDSSIENSLFFILYLVNPQSRLSSSAAQLPSRVPTIILSVPALPMATSHELQLTALTHQAARLAKRFLQIDIGPIRIAATLVPGSFCVATLSVFADDITALRDMVTAANTLLHELAGLRFEHWVRVRLFLTVSDRQDSIYEQLGRVFAEFGTDVAPAISLIPVLDLDCYCRAPDAVAPDSLQQQSKPHLVALLYAYDLQALEANLWMHHGR